MTSFVEHRTALLSIAIEDAMQLCGQELIGQRLRPLPVVSGEGGGRAAGEEWQQVGAAEAGDVEGRTLYGGKHARRG